MKRTNPRKGRAEDPASSRLAGMMPWISLQKSSTPFAPAVRWMQTGIPGLQRVLAAVAQLRPIWEPSRVASGLGSDRPEPRQRAGSEMPSLGTSLWGVMAPGLTVAADTPLAEYIVSFGLNSDASGGVCGVRRLQMPAPRRNTHSAGAAPVRYRRICQ